MKHPTETNTSPGQVEVLKRINHPVYLAEIHLECWFTLLILKEELFCGVTNCPCKVKATDGQEAVECCEVASAWGEMKPWPNTDPQKSEFLKHLMEEACGQCPFPWQGVGTK